MIVHVTRRTRQHCLDAARMNGKCEHTSQLQDFCSKIFQYRRRVDRCLCADTHIVLCPLFQIPVDTTYRKLDQKKQLVTTPSSLCQIKHRVLVTLPVGFASAGSFALAGPVARMPRPWTFLTWMGKAWYVKGGGINSCSAKRYHNTMLDGRKAREGSNAPNGMQRCIL